MNSVVSKYTVSKSGSILQNVDCGMRAYECKASKMCYDVKLLST